MCHFLQLVEQTPKKPLSDFNLSTNESYSSSSGGFRLGEMFFLEKSNTNGVAETRLLDQQPRRKADGQKKKKHQNCIWDVKKKENNLSLKFYVSIV